MSRSAFRVFVIALPLLAVIVSACGTEAPPAVPTVPTIPTNYVLTTESFNGALVSGASFLYSFHTMPGAVTVTLASVDPATGAPPIGLVVGMWDGISCTTVLESTQAAPGTVLVGTASIESDVCVKVLDPSTLPADYTLTYQVTAVHYTKPPL